MTWRVGHRVPLNVYDGDRPVCQCHTPEDAARIVEAVNAVEATTASICMGCNGTGHRVQQYVGNTPVLKPCETCNGAGGARLPLRPETRDALVERLNRATCTDADNITVPVAALREVVRASEPTRGEAGDGEPTDESSERFSPGDPVVYEDDGHDRTGTVTRVKGDLVFIEPSAAPRHLVTRPRSEVLRGRIAPKPQKDWPRAQKQGWGLETYTGDPPPIPTYGPGSRNVEAPRHTGEPPSGDTPEAIARDAVYGDQSNEGNEDRIAARIRALVVGARIDELARWVGGLGPVDEPNARHRLRRLRALESGGDQ